MMFVYKVRFSFCFAFCFIKEYLCHINYDRGITTLFQLSIYAILVSWILICILFSFCHLHSIQLSLRNWTKVVSRKNLTGICLELVVVPSTTTYSVFTCYISPSLGAYKVKPAISFTEVFARAFCQYIFNIYSCRSSTLHSLAVILYFR